MEPLSGLASKKVGKVLVSAYVSLGVQEYHFPGYLIIRLTMMTDVKCLQLGKKGLVNEGWLWVNRNSGLCHTIGFSWWASVFPVPTLGREADFL